MKKINVAIIGIGHDHAYDAFEYITKAESSFNLIGIVIEENNNGNYDKWKEFYDAYPHLYVDDVVNNNDIDAVLIESDDSQLTRYATIFANKGIPVHMDKPGSQSKESFGELISACKKNKTILHLGYMYRYNPSVKEAIKICKSGSIGKIYSIDAQMSTYLPKEKRQWLSLFKGGMMNYLGCHLIDIVISILGEPDEIVSNLAKSSNDVGEDICSTTFKYGNYFSQIFSSGVEYDGFSRRHITISAEKMCIDISPTEAFVTRTDLTSTSTYKTPVAINNVPIGNITYGPVNRYKEMFEEFASIVRKEINNPYSLDYELMVHNTLLKACGIK